MKQNSQLEMLQRSNHFSNTQKQRQHKSSKSIKSKKSNTQSIDLFSANFTIGNSQSRSKVYRYMQEGSIFYKSFGSRQYIQTSKVFDPLQSDKKTPEQCGYGIRFFKLEVETNSVGISQNLRNSVESRFCMNEVVKVVLP